ncbi:MAG: fused MFS/spermidine synthase [Planctomycetota bacterium]
MGRKETGVPKKRGGTSRMLALVVFLSGASLMSLELVGSRVIAPTFGSSIYTWGSLIGIFMLALSIGYFFGGRLADRKPSYYTLAFVLGLAGVLTLVIPFVAFEVCLQLAPLKQKWGSFVACLILFGPPSILMGMVSPLAIRLAAREIESVGGVAGLLYAISTFGSIFGTFLTSFFLLELMGMSNLVRAVGVALVFTALIALVMALKGKKANISHAAAALLLIGITTVACLISAPLSFKSAGAEVLATSDSPYNTLFVVDSSDGERKLQFNERSESGFYLSQPHRSSFQYTIGIHMAFALNKNARNILLVGGGGAVLPIEMLCAYDDVDMQIDSVEIDPGVIDYSQRYFVNHAVKVFEESENPAWNNWATRVRERLHLIEADGRTYVRTCGNKYDMIIMDAYLGGRIPFHLCTTEFFADLRNCLADDGVLAMNIISGWRGKTSKVFKSIYRTVNQHFPNIVLVPSVPFAGFGFTNVSDLHKTHEQPQNIILIATLGDDKKMTGEQFRGAVKALGERGFYPYDLYGDIRIQLASAGTVEDFEKIEKDIIDRMASSGGARPDFEPLVPEDTPILTDEYSPVDIWSGYIMLHAR